MIIRIFKHNTSEIIASDSGDFFKALKPPLNVFEIEGSLYSIIDLVETAPAGSGWLLDGNSNGALRYLGTNDNFDLPFRTNGIEVARVQTDGSFQIGGVTIGGGEKLNIQNSTFPITAQLSNTVASGGLHYGIYSTVTGGGGGTNVGGYFSASGGALGQNFAAIFASGNVQINENILDSAGLDSILPTNRRLLDTTGGIALNWELKTLVDTAGFTSVDWESRMLSDASGQPSLDWASRYLLDNTGAAFVDWSGGFLASLNGLMQIDLGNGAYINISTDAGADLESFIYLDSTIAGFTTANGSLDILSATAELTLANSVGVFRIGGAIPAATTQVTLTAAKTYLYHGTLVEIDTPIVNLTGDLRFTTKAIDAVAGDSATINSPAGRFRKDTSGTTFTLTNSYITANSIIQLTFASAPGVTGYDQPVVVAAAGSAVITFSTSGAPGAPTADTDVNFLVIN